MPTPGRPRPPARLLVALAFTLGGGAAGYAFHRVVGCPSGGCPITGSAWISTLYGLLVGLVLGLGLAPARRLR